MKLHAGAATSNITPWLGVTMPGSFLPRYGEDVHDELLAKALVIDNGDVRIAMVTCDLIAMPEAIANAVKARIKERCGISPECVMVNATHTHSGAGVSNLLSMGEDEGYTTMAPAESGRCSGVGRQENAACPSGVCQCDGGPYFVLSALADEGWDSADESGF